MNLLQDLIRGKLTGGGGADGGYELLGSGSYTWAGGSTIVRIPISYSGTAKRFGAVADEHSADTAQEMCYCELLENTQLVPNEFAAPDNLGKFTYAWGYRANNTIVHHGYGSTTPLLSASEMTLPQVSGTTYPWRPSTYHWYIWGVTE